MFGKSKDKKDGFEPDTGPSSDPPPPFQEKDGESSTLQPAFKTKFACLTLNSLDRVRLINFPELVNTAIRGTVNTYWPKGIYPASMYGESYEIQTHGSPWTTSSHGDDDARRVLLRMFEKLFDLGWVHQAAISVTGKSSSKDSLVFRKQDPAPPPCTWILISFDRYDKLKVIGGPPPDLVTALLKTFSSELDRYERDSDRMKITFLGTPWMPSGKETVKTRLMLLELLECLESCGFTVYAAVDMTSNSERETDVVICQRQKGWTPGAPVWHR